MVLKNAYNLYDGLQKLGITNLRQQQEAPMQAIFDGKDAKRMKKSAEEVIADTVRGYTTVVPENSNVSMSGGKAQYALYPVWILNTTWKDTRYIFAMNGQTGKMTGDLPIDEKIYRKYLAGLTVVFTAIAYLVGMLIF